MKRYDNIFMGWKNNKPYREFDFFDGNNKWDVNDRATAALVDNTSPIFPLFPQSKIDDHGVEIPYKTTIKIVTILVIR